MGANDDEDFFDYIMSDPVYFFDVQEGGPLTLKMDRTSIPLDAIYQQEEKHCGLGVYYSYNFARIVERGRGTDVGYIGSARSKLMNDMIEVSRQFIMKRLELLFDDDDYH